MHSYRLRAQLPAILCLLAMNCLLSVGQTERGSAQRLVLKNGRAAAAGSLKHGTETSYLLSARRGQRFTVRLTRNSRDCWFNMLDPGGEGLPEEEQEANLSLAGRFEQTGDYKIIVSAMSQDARYTLSVTVR